MSDSSPTDPRHPEAGAEAAPGVVWWALGAWWLPAILGLAYLGESRAGVETSSAIPAVLELRATGDVEANITVCVHPGCPCTPRTLDLLAAIVDERPGFRVTVLKTVPTGGEAADVPRLDGDPTRGGRFALRRDPGGALARALGAERSGHAVVSDPAGRVVFSGGVVGGGTRCATDRSAVRTALDELDRLLGGSAPPSRAPVDGCPLVLEEAPGR